MADVSSCDVLLLGSIGVLAETSEMQREAYNWAFEDHGLAWRWSAEVYPHLLVIPGGQNRLRVLAAATGTELTEADVKSIHRSKVENLQKRIANDGLQTRAGVKQLIAAARDAGRRLAIVSGTDRSTIEAIADATALQLDHFDLVISGDDGYEPKPAPAPYTAALKRLDVSADQVVAVEDTVTSMSAALGAGLRTLAVPGAVTAHERYAGAALVVDGLADGDGELRTEVRELLGL